GSQPFSNTAFIYSSNDNRDVATHTLFIFPVSSGDCHNYTLACLCYNLCRITCIPTPRELTARTLQITGGQHCCCIVVIIDNLAADPR
ncbi:hypothetical protein OFD51_30035, partial [Escherichia coli]|nr:hypothetical protein [Escherichia coli]